MTVFANSQTTYITGSKPQATFKKNTSFSKPKPTIITMSYTNIHQPTRSSFTQRCSQLAHRTTSSHNSNKNISSPPPAADTTTTLITQWLQRLPARRSEYEDFFEAVLEAAVSRLVHGTHAAAEEAELGFEYDRFEDAKPGTWVRVRARSVRLGGKRWIHAEVLGGRGEDEEEGEEREEEVYAWGRWVVVRLKRCC